MSVSERLPAFGRFIAFLRGPRLPSFFALSRTPHGLMDMTMPLAAACLYLGALPSFFVAVLGLGTVFAGYTAVYALNDLVDYRLDKERLARSAFKKRSASEDLDAALVRHPLAQGLVSFPTALAWACGWGLIAFIGAWLFNPVCVGLLVLGCVLEVAYCRLFRITPLRTLVNGVVKTLGPVAAVFAVDPSPSASFVIVLFFYLFLWEIGGQNIPNDSMDLEEDRGLRARTIPVCFGMKNAALISFAALLSAAVVLPVLFHISPAGVTPAAALAVALIAVFLFIRPGLAFYRSLSPDDAGALFNQASRMPPALLLSTILWLVFQ